MTAKMYDTRNSNKPMANILGMTLNKAKIKFFMTLIRVMRRKARKIRKDRTIWTSEKDQLIVMIRKSNINQPSKKSRQPW
mmetsp:Transcript_24724/g.68346  ORF Transcript_24724/g.68346 Transcript_24724/m.68346 type:complete len:80 (-) Transcript_24724:607-846(-)